MKVVGKIAQTVVGGLVCALALFIGYVCWDDRQVSAALEAKYGTVEKNFSPANISHCPWGSHTSAFLIYPREDPIEGYVCTSLWRKPKVVEGPLDLEDRYRLYT